MSFTFKLVQESKQVQVVVIDYIVPSKWCIISTPVEIVLKLKVDKAQDLVRAQGRGTIRIIVSVGQIF